MALGYSPKNVTVAYITDMKCLKCWKFMWNEIPGFVDSFRSLIFSICSGIFVFYIYLTCISSCVQHLVEGWTKQWIKWTAVYLLIKYTVHSWHDCSLRHLELNLLSFLTFQEHGFCLQEHFRIQEGHRSSSHQSIFYQPIIQAHSSMKQVKDERHLFLEAPHCL